MQCWHEDIASVNDHSRVDPILTLVQQQRTQPLAKEAPAHSTANLWPRELLYSYLRPLPLSIFSSCLRPFQLSSIPSTLLPDKSGQEAHINFRMLRQRHFLEGCLTSEIGKCAMLVTSTGLRTTDFYQDANCKAALSS